MISLDNIYSAHKRIKPFIHNTAVLTSARINVLSGASLFFKCENRNTNSFINLNSIDKLKFLERIAFGEDNNIEEIKEKRKKISKEFEKN